MEIKKSITVNQSLEKVWEIMATDYTKVGEWTSQISFSKNNDAVTRKLEGAPASGRVCTAPGFGDVKETITHFDETLQFSFLSRVLRLKIALMAGLEFINYMDNYD